MVGKNKLFNGSVRSVAFAAGAMIATLAGVSPALAAPGTVTVTAKSGGVEIGVGYRWLLEEDSTYYVDPGQPDADTTTNTLALNMHKSHMNVVAQGRSSSNPATITIPDTSRRYYLSVLPEQVPVGTDPMVATLDCNVPGNCFTQSGRQVTPDLFAGGTSASLTVALASQPVPTAQIYARAFQDSAPINGVWDNGEKPLGGWTVFIYDMGGQMMADTFGNPLGTVYDANGNVLRRGDGTLHTMTAEEAADPARNPYGIAEGDVLIKGIAPGKYGVQMVPPRGQEWQQVSTIEGTRGIDVWVKANEPRYFAEFGAAGHHAEFGFITTNPVLNDFPKAGDPDYATYFGGGNTITGRITNMRGTRPPEVKFTGGHPLPGCWVGLNNGLTTRGLTAVSCDADSNFTISGVKDGTYQLAIWDKYLDNVIAFQTVTVANGSGGALGDVPVFRWFGELDHYVFNDANENGVWDTNERGIPDQVVNLRYRDGSIYNSSTTDTAGTLPFNEIFPFFSWLVAEVDYARFKATGVTVVSDAGGAIPTDPIALTAGGVLPEASQGLLTPQAQAECERLGATVTTAADGSTTCTGGNLWARVELAGGGPPPLTQGYNAFLGTTNVLLWGKRAWNPGENGGITGVVYYQTTRAENDPRFAAPETWEPGIPRVQVALYHSDARGNLYHKLPDGSRGALAGSGSPIDLADVDNYPLGNFPLADGGVSAEDTDNHPAVAAFQLGDAIEVTHTDSYDDSSPEGCRPHQNADGSPWNPADSFYLDGKCFDGLRNYSQVRSAVFDGGYAFGKPFTDTPIAPGYYVVQASPPKGVDGTYVYEIQQEEDKNVDFGDAMAISPQALPPYCVGGVATDGTVMNNGVAPHDTGATLSLFSTTDGPIGIDPAVMGAQRPGCDFRLVQVTDGKNAAADFFMFTETPITGHIQGFVLNDVANEFNPLSPNFGEKIAPSWIPVSVRDYEGNEVYHTYTDKWGTYNAIVPSTFRINTPMPSGVSPNMLQVCLNAPTTQDADGNWVPEPRHNRQYTQFCYTLDFKPGQTTYLDTPVLPVAAFVGPSNWQLDCEYPSGTPVINYATVGSNGPYISNASGASRVLDIYSMGEGPDHMTEVEDPLAPRIDSTITGSTNAKKVKRDFGFGSSAGRVWIGNTEIPAASVSWANDKITVNVPAGVATGQLRIRRANGMETVHGLTVSIDQPGQPTSVVHTVLPNTGNSHNLQDAIDSANAGDLIMVRPGVYLEMLVMTKPVRLQGWGASSTIVNPVQSPTQKIADWRAKLNSLVNCTHTIGLLPGQPNNAAGTGGISACGFVPGTGLFTNEEGAGILVAPVEGVFSAALAVGLEARIDGMTFSGSDQAAGIMVNAYATGLEISNNITSNNQGSYAAGIRIGQPLLTVVGANGVEAPVDAQNDGLKIHHNHVAENGGLAEAGAGIGLYTGTDGYQVNRNFVCGNNAGGNGAGIAHYGRSEGGRILDNTVLFNQAFDQTVQNSGNGGGILVAGYMPAAGGATPGTGSVLIERNLIQGNNAGSGEGGGIAIQQLDAGGTSKLVTIRNNIIVNNVAGYAGGGISMDNATRVAITNNTIVNNDTSGTSAAAFSSTVTPACTGSATTRSCPQPAGVISHGGNIGASGLRNNIILGNRAFHVELKVDPATNGVILETVADGFSDLGGTSLFSGTSDGIRDSLLGDTNIALSTAEWAAVCAAGTTRKNTCVVPEEGPAGVYATHFVMASWNRAPYWFGATGAEYQPAEAATAAGLNAGAVIAVASDEGGNFIDIHYGPLSRVLCYAGTTGCAGTTLAGSTEVLVDYHLTASAANAIDLADNGSSPSDDVDSQSRPKSGATTTTTNISVANNSFESPDVSGESLSTPASWTSNAVGTGGTYDPPGSELPTSGSQAAWAANGREISQLLTGITLDANTSYRLRVDVGDRSGSTGGVTNSFAGYRIQLWAGTTLLAESLNAVMPNDGRTEVTLSYLAGPTPPAGNLQIRLAAIATGGATADPARTYFDNVRLDKSVTSTANPADRGADEFHAVSTDGGAYVPGTTPNNNVTNLPPVLAAISAQSAVAGVPFKYQVFAADPNGDALSYRVCGNASCSAAAPAGMSISALGFINWTPAWPNAGCSGGTTTTDNCNVTVQVSDNGFGAGGNTCSTSGATANCAARNFQISLRNYVGTGPAAPAGGIPAYAVTTMGTFTVASPGVLGFISNSNSTVPLTVQLTNPASGVIPGVGTVVLAANGSFSFTPETSWVGTSSFQATVSDGKNSVVVTVPLTRDIAVTTARYINGAWTFEGRGATAGRRIQIVRDGGGNIATGNARPTVTGGTWAFTLSGAPAFQFGDTVTVTAQTDGGSSQFVLAAVPVLSGAASDVVSTSYVQCPVDANKDGLVSDAEAAIGRGMNPPVVCRHLAAGDGFSVMADNERTPLYTFGFSDVTKVEASKAIGNGILNAQFPGPTLDFDEGDEVYLTLTNVGMLLRPDLFDPHSVHFHGFPNAAAVFDGVPESSITINMGFSLTYYYKTMDPGTYMYHCHVEAAEHMQMGMLGNLYVRPAQNRLAAGTVLGSFTHQAGNLYVYNDGDGSTAYDVEFPIQIGSFDRNFHEQHIGVQPLPFAEMHDDYPLLNGRGYPDTVDQGAPPPASDKVELADPAVATTTSQPMNSRIVIPNGKKALLRISNLNVTRFYTLATTGLPMQVVGTGAHILRGPADANMYYTTNSVTLGGGEGADVLINTAGIAAGTYLLYSTNLEALSNGAEDFGGMMTEIQVCPGAVVNGACAAE